MEGNQVCRAPRTWQDAWHLVRTQPFFVEGRRREERGVLLERERRSVWELSGKEQHPGLKPP